MEVKNVSEYEEKLAKIESMVQELVSVLEKKSQSLEQSASG
jgi:uncharacterized protein YejL (UPF0352 family)